MMEKAKTIFVLTTIYYLLSTFFMGCTTFYKPDKGIQAPEVLEPQIAAKFSDVPVPAGFKLLPQDSYSFEAAGVRVGFLKYYGKAGVDQVVNFYKDQMPMYNWNLLNVVEYGERIINFDRENETCIVSLLPKGNKVTVTISVGPKAQAPKKVDRPVK